MNIWVILWIVLSMTLIGIFIWSNLALYDQKKAWKAFAKKCKLKYYPNGFLKSPMVVKKFDWGNFRLFSEEQYTNDIGRRRFTTVFEVMLPGMPTNGIIASSELATIVSAAQVRDRIKDPPGEWNPKDFIVALDAVALMPYLTSRRMDAIRSLIKIKNSRFLFAFDTNQGVLRLETNNPLLKTDKVIPIYKKFIEKCEILIPTQEDHDKAEKAMEELKEKSEEIRRANRADRDRDRDRNSD